MLFVYYNLNEDFLCWWFDEYVKLFLIGWYWPNFVMGNYDEWASMGITLNGIRPANLCPK